MIGIKAIASYIPEQTVDNVARGLNFGETEDFILNRIGARFLPIKDSGDETSDLAVKAVLSLFKKCPLLIDQRVDALLVVTQNGDGSGLPHCSAIVQRKLGLSNGIAAFDVSLGCSGYVYALHILKGFMESSRLESGILITADPYSKIIDPVDRTTSLLFGDAATATWIGHDPEWVISDVLYGTDGSGAAFLHSRDGKLEMNGRQIFNFAINEVGPHIRALLRKSGYSETDIDLFFIHQGSAAIVDAIAKQFVSVSDRFVRNLNNTGNTVSSSLPLLLERLAFEEKFSRVLLSGFGVGLSWASVIMSRNFERGNL